MNDDFERIEQNYQHACDSISRRTKQLPTLNGERKKLAVREADQDIGEAMQFIQEMDRAAQNHPQRVRLQQKIKQYRSDVEKLKRDVQTASTTQSGNNNYGGQYNGGYGGNNFSNQPEDYQAQYDNQRQHLLAGHDSVQQSSERLTRIVQTSITNEQIGENIMMDLGKQRHQIINMTGKLEETDENIKSARKVIGSMARRVVTNKVILTFIILLLLGIIGLIICLKWLR